MAEEEEEGEGGTDVVKTAIWWGERGFWAIDAVQRGRDQIRFAWPLEEIVTDEEEEEEEEDIEEEEEEEEEEEGGGR